MDVADTKQKDNKTMEFIHMFGQFFLRPHTTDFPQNVAKEGKSSYFKEI